MAWILATALDDNPLFHNNLRYGSVMALMFNTMHLKFFCLIFRVKSPPAYYFELITTCFLLNARPNWSIRFTCGC